MTQLTILAALLASLAPPRPDVLPLGYKSVAGTVQFVVADEVRQVAIVGHRITKGETLGKIAKADLGSGKRWPEIAALNPEIDPDKLVVGAVIWLPPTDRAADPDDVVYLFGRGQLGRRSAPLVPGEPVGDHYGGGVVAVPRARLGAYREFLAHPHREKVEWLCESPIISRPRSLPASHPAARVETHYRVTEVGRDTVTIEQLETRYFNRSGEPVDPGAVRRSRMLLLGLLAMVGIIGLALVARRRRGAPPAPMRGASGTAVA